jgi:hypothetical protein
VIGQIGAAVDGEDGLCGYRGDKNDDKDGERDEQAE